MGTGQEPWQHVERADAAQIAHVALHVRFGFG
jgi:hypothetical protein